MVGRLLSIGNNGEESSRNASRGRTDLAIVSPGTSVRGVRPDWASLIFANGVGDAFGEVENGGFGEEKTRDRKRRRGSEKPIDREGAWGSEARA